MPQIDYSPENKLSSSFDFPRLKLEKGELARIICLENPTFEWVHDLRMPQVVNGKPVFETKKRKDGSTYQDYSMDWVGNPICLGDLGILADKKSDPDNCPACEAAKKTDQVPAPKRRFAMNIIQYVTRNDGQLIKPFSCSVKVWGFTERIFTKLHGFNTEWGDLRKHDLNLGPCDDKQWQRFEIAVAKDAIWLSDPKLTEIVKETFAENKVADLSPACGRRSERQYVRRDIEKIAERWATINGNVELPEDGTTGAFDGKGLAEGLSDLNSALDDPAPQPAKPTGNEVDLGSMVKGPAVDEPKQETPVEKTPQPVAAGLDDIFAGLDDL